MYLNLRNILEFLFGNKKCNVIIVMSAKNTRQIT